MHQHHHRQYPSHFHPTVPWFRTRFCKINKCLDGLNKWLFFIHVWIDEHCNTDVLLLSLCFWFTSFTRVLFDASVVLFYCENVLFVSTAPLNCFKFFSPFNNLMLQMILSFKLDKIEKKIGSFVFSLWSKKNVVPNDTIQSRTGSFKSKKLSKGELQISDKNCHFLIF